MRIILAAILTLTLPGCVTNNMNTESSVNPAGYLFFEDLYTDGDIISGKNISTFKELVFLRETQIFWYDGRKITANGWNKSTFKVFVFTAKFLKGNDIKIRVNAEFKTKSKAQEQALKYAKLIGKLPNFLRTKNLKTLTIQKGSGLWGGNNDIIIATEGGEGKYIEELLAHEAGHVTLDPNFGGSINIYKWNKAAKADNKFISHYAKEFPKREDIGETIPWWIAVRCKSSGISKQRKLMVLDAIPNRLKYLDEQKFDTYPLVCK